MYGWESIAMAIGAVQGRLEASKALQEHRKFMRECDMILWGISKPVYFQHCAYCTKAPDEGQKEARCTSCGAPLREKEKVDRIL